MLKCSSAEVDQAERRGGGTVAADVDAQMERQG